MLLYARHVCIQLSGVIPCLSADVMTPLLTRLPKSGHFLRVCWRHHVSLDPSAQVLSVSADVITSLLTFMPKSRHISLDPSAQVWSLRTCLLVSLRICWPFCPSLTTQGPHTNSVFYSLWNLHVESSCLYEDSTFATAVIFCIALI